MLQWRSIGRWARAVEEQRGRESPASELMEDIDTYLRLARRMVKAVVKRGETSMVGGAEVVDEFWKLTSKQVGSGGKVGGTECDGIEIKVEDNED